MQQNLHVLLLAHQATLLLMVGAKLAQTTAMNAALLILAPHVHQVMP
jgi:hypothetical protein